jgi:hypothetical protein
MIGKIKKLFNPGNDDKTLFKPRLDEEHQVLSALQMVGAGFETRGGVSLMMTEAVENGVDSIIEAKKNGQVHKKSIQVIIDKPQRRVIVIDDGYGFQDVRHVCEKPFKSLKVGDADYTGKFARGLQGFRSFCNKLTFITRRPTVPKNEHDYLKKNISASGRTVQIEFESSSIGVTAHYVDDERFSKYSKAPHGAVAIYEEWKAGEFEKLRKEDIIKRIEHHFGELIRQGEIKIIITIDEGKIEKIGPDQVREYECKPRDYSEFQKIDIAPISYAFNGSLKGDITFNLYLTDRGRPDRWNFPYLLFKKRPVGDGFVSDLDEFRDGPVWESQFLTGYITCDFCEINSLRQALVPSKERDFLYTELKKIEYQLEKMIRKHARGIYNIRLQQHITELVVDLQKFLKQKNIFNFKTAKSSGLLAKGETDVEIVELAAASGMNMDKEFLGQGDDAAQNSTGMVKTDAAKVDSSTEGNVFTHQTDFGGHGGSNAESKEGGSGAAANSNGTESGHVESNNGMQKPIQKPSAYELGGDEKSKGRVKRPRPKGFGMTMQDNEFDEEPSWFDAVASAVVINSGHPRYQNRFTLGAGKKMSQLMHYLAELYLWEICKLAYGKEAPEKMGAKFLTLKFEYFEKEVKDDSSE